MSGGRPRSDGIRRATRYCSTHGNTEWAQYTQNYPVWVCMECHNDQQRSHYAFKKSHPGVSYRSPAKPEPVHQACCPRCWTTTTPTGACLCD